MIHLIGFSGSLRRASYNSAVLRAAARLVPDNCELRIESIAQIPLYNADVESAQGAPEAVARLKDLIAESDGLVIATPEYNNGIPGVAKNVIDWLSRPPADGARVFRGRPVAIMGASPGGFGTVSSQNAWLPVLRSLGASVWPETRLAISRVSGLVDASDELVDEKTLGLVREFIGGFAAHVARVRAARS
jgi:NAD(P)H-dependent FMN reductase